MIELLEEPFYKDGKYYFEHKFGGVSEISGIERTFRLKINEIIDKINMEE